MTFVQFTEAIHLLGPSCYLPQRVVGNDELLRAMNSDVPGSWIEKRTGVTKRHYAAPDEACSDLAAKAARQLFSRHDVDPRRIRQVLVATGSGDYPVPPTAPIVQHALQLERCGAFDIGAACAGFVTGLGVAATSCLVADEDQLLVAADIRSRFLDADDISTKALFGDGASAALISRHAEGASFIIKAYAQFARGEHADLVGIKAGGSRNPFGPDTSIRDTKLKMPSGAALFASAVRGMRDISLEFLGLLDLPAQAIDWFVPHQANLRLLEGVANALSIPMSRVATTVADTGNTSGSSIGIALAALCERPDALKRGTKILLTAAGGGGIGACALLESL